jgi:RHS repeat-associated protein
LHPATRHTTNTLTMPSGHRFTYNGKEADNEVYGEGNLYDYGFRIYNPRLGKFLSVDPLTSTFPFLTPYQYASNKPIVAIDLDGLECLWVHIYKDKDGTKLRTTTTQDVSDEQRAEASNTLGFELPTNGVVVTSEQEGQKKLDYYSPEIVINAKRTEPSKTTKIINAIKEFDQKLQGSNWGTTITSEDKRVAGNIVSGMLGIMLTGNPTTGFEAAGLLLNINQVVSGVTEASDGQNKERNILREGAGNASGNVGETTFDILDATISFTNARKGFSGAIGGLKKNDAFETIKKSGSAGLDTKSGIDAVKRLADSNY